jgi:hypothetical protein
MFVFLSDFRISTIAWYFCFCQILDLLRERGIFVFLSDFRIAAIVWYVCVSVRFYNYYDIVVFLCFCQILELLR